MRQHPALCRKLLLMAAVTLVLMRDAVLIGARRVDVIVEQLTFGEELATIGVVPSAPQTTAPTLQHLPRAQSPRYSPQIIIIIFVFYDVTERMP